MQMSRWERACKRHDLVGILVDTGRQFKGAFVFPRGRVRSPMPVREARRYADSLNQSERFILETLRSHMRSGEPVAAIVRRRATRLRGYTVFGICVDCIDESNSMISLTERNHSYTFLAESVRLRDIKRIALDN